MKPRTPIKKIDITKESEAPASAINGYLLCFLTALAAEVILGYLRPSIFSTSLSRLETGQVVGRVMINVLGLSLLHNFAVVCLRKYQASPKNLLTIHLVMIGSLVILSLGHFLSAATVNYAQSQHVLGAFSESSLHYAIPYATGALLVQAVLGMHHGLIFSVGLSVIVGVYSGEAMITIYCLFSCLLACLSLTRFRTRSAYIRAGFHISTMMFPVALCSLLFEPSITAHDIIVRLLGAFSNGMLSVFLFAGLTPIVEYLGGYVTDMRLLEMATLDHPLLKELSLTAPGTWNHSMVMGMMSETAADAIGANPVLARVGAYFHDIGKMKKPLYFVENQVPGDNRHDKLSTSMSALIIRSHVKDGIELAKKHNLPVAIVDMIPQHHGTSTIEYFYKKALKEAEESEENIEVDKTLYTYPGPKPQTKEAGILLLADGIEAATRTLSEPSHDRIQGLVQKMINKVFASGELNECDLTLKDLHEIAKCFTRVLTAIYHQRISYFEPAEKTNEKKSSDDASAGKSTAARSKSKSTAASEKSKTAAKSATDDASSGKASSSGDSNSEANEHTESEEEAPQKEQKKTDDLKRLGM